MIINNFTKEDLVGSYIYFIFSRELLYIGETQKIAFVRWASHLYNKGTLMQKIEAFGDPAINYRNSLNFISINCKTIRSDFTEIRWKTISQAVEHSIHKLLYSSQSMLMEHYFEKYEPSVKRYVIISDTSRTAPASIPKREWDFADNYAQELLLNLCIYF